MIPDIPILKSPIKFSGLSTSSYNPYNLILKIIGRTESEYTFNDFIEYNATLIHEWTHWIQHHGTTFGVFLNALRYTQEHTTLGHLRELPQDVSKDLLLRRNSNPLILIDERTGIFKAQKFPKQSEYLNLFGQIWFDLQWTQSFLNDSNIASSTGAPTRQIFGDSIGDIFIHYFSKTVRGPKEVFELRQWYNFEDKIQLIRFSGTHLTTHLLMECSSTINEVQFLHNNTDTALSNFLKSEHFNKRMQLLIDSSYGIPLKLFLQQLDLNFFHIYNICSTLNLIIFVALNPPVPPYHVGPPRNRKSWKWAEIYPPMRYIKAIEAVRKVGFIKQQANHNETLEYLQKIIEVSGLPTIIENSFNLPSSFREIDFSDDSIIYDPNNISFDSVDYSCWTQKQFSALRNNSLPFITNFANCLVGDLASKYVDLVIPESKVHFTKAPFVWQTDGKLGFCYDENFCNSLLRQVSVAYCLFDLAVGQGEYNLEEFSPEVGSSSTYKEFVNNNIYNAVINVRNN